MIPSVKTNVAQLRRCALSRTTPLLFLTCCWLYGGQARAVLPDLIINRQLAVETVYFETRTFGPDDCAFIEGCTATTGQRKLLRFAIGFANIGKGDLVIGDPRERPDMFTYSPCHGHYHFDGAASYWLLNSKGVRVRSSKKQAFCLLDFSKYANFGRKYKRYDCDYQGISSGWQDIYTKNLDCQWIDVTGLKPGNYTLRLKVNPLRKFEESNYRNNTASVPITIH